MLIIKEIIFSSLIQVKYLNMIIFLNFGLKYWNWKNAVCIKWGKSVNKLTAQMNLNKNNSKADTIGYKVDARLINYLQSR